MLRISLCEANADMARLVLEGRLVGPWVAELRKACDPILAEGRALTLQLEEVTFADGQGVALLLHLRSRGVTLAGYSPFVEQQLQASRMATMFPQSQCDISGHFRTD